MDQIIQIGGRETILVGNFNAKSLFWELPITARNKNYWIEWISTPVIVVHNLWLFQDLLEEILLDLIIYYKIPTESDDYVEFHRNVRKSTTNYPRGEDWGFSREQQPFCSCQAKLCCT